MTTTAELRAKKKVKEAEISQTMDRIEDRLEYYADWRNSVQQAPILSVVAAFGASMLVSGLAVPLLFLAGRQTGSMMQNSMTACLANLFSQGLRRVMIRS
jgi:hypothetical protein